MSRSWEDKLPEVRQISPQLAKEHLAQVRIKARALLQMVLSPEMDKNAGRKRWELYSSVNEGLDICLHAMDRIGFDVEKAIEKSVAQSTRARLAIQDVQDSEGGPS